jgi:hypothetical protein
VGRGDRAVLVHNGWDCIKKPVIDDALESGAVNGTTAYRAGATRPPRHHVFPQNDADKAWFKARGVDVDRYTLPLDEGTHGALHYGGGPGKGGGFWNDEIMSRLMAREAALGRQLTRREILAIGAQMRRQFVPGIKIIPYNAP